MRIAGLAFVVVASVAAWIGAPIDVVVVTAAFGLVSFLQFRAARQRLACGRAVHEQVPHLKVVAARERANVAITSFGLFVLLVQLPTGGRSTRAGLLCALIDTAWVLQRRSIAGRKRSGGLGRLLTRGNAVREEITGAFNAFGARPDAAIPQDGVMRASLVTYVAAIGVWVAVLSCAQAPKSVEERFVQVAHAVGLRLGVDEPSEPAEPTGAHPTPQATVGPTARPRRTCTPEEAKTLLAKGVTKATATALYEAWFEFGVEDAGCPTPTKPPEASGSLWVAALDGGEDPHAFVVGNDHGAAVVLSDFAGTIGPVTGEIAGVEGRMRWGAGSAQVVTYRDHTCRLLSVRDYGDVINVPPSVTALVLEEALRRQAFPRIDAAVPSAGGTRYEVSLLTAAPALFGARVVTTLNVQYDPGAHRAAVVGGAKARDNAACPGPREPLATAAAGIDDAADVYRSASPTP